MKFSRNSNYSKYSTISFQLVRILDRIFANLTIE